MCLAGGCCVELAAAAAAALAPQPMHAPRRRPRPLTDDRVEQQVVADVAFELHKGSAAARRSRRRREGCHFAFDASEGRPRAQAGAVRRDLNAPAAASHTFLGLARAWSARGGSRRARQHSLFSFNTGPESAQRLKSLLHAFRRFIRAHSTPHRTLNSSLWPPCRARSPRMALHLRAAPAPQARRAQKRPRWRRIGAVQLWLGARRVCAAPAARAYRKARVAPANHTHLQSLSHAQQFVRACRRRARAATTALAPGLSQSHPCAERERSAPDARARRRRR